MHIQTCQIKQNVILFGQILNLKTSFFLGRRSIHVDKGEQGQKFRTQALGFTYFVEDLYLVQECSQKKNLVQE
jgi:hypothetical protein